MYSLLLIIIYLAFISLGLPDSLLGSAWPVMYRQFEVPLSYAGIVAMIITGGTIISSLLSDGLTRKLGAGQQLPHKRAGPEQRISLGGYYSNCFDSHSFYKPSSLEEENSIPRERWGVGACIESGQGP